MSAPVRKLEAAKVGDDLPTEVQGKPVPGAFEAIVSKALETMGWDFEYQYPVFGGRRVKGGIVLDWLVYTKPRPTPLFGQGKYWHNLGQRPETDRIQMAKLRSRLRRYFAPAKEIWDYEAPDVDTAMRNLTRILGRP